MAEENIWTKLSFDVDLEKGEVKEVEQLAPKEEEVVQEETQEQQVAREEEEDKKRPSRTERLKRQRDKALEEAERLRIALAQTQQQAQGAVATLDTTMRSQLEITKKALESKKEAAQKAFLNAFEQGDKEALLAAQTALVEVDGDLRELSSKTPPKVEKPDSVQNVQPEPTQNAPRGPSAKTKAWIKANPWFDEDEEMRGAALGIHTKLLKDDIEPESDEYFEAIEKRMRKLFPEKFSGEDDEEEVVEKPRKKAPPVSGSGVNKGDGGKLRLRVTKDDQEAARRLGVPLDLYMLNKGKMEDVGYDPNKRENSYVKIF